MVNTLLCMQCRQCVSKDEIKFVPVDKENVKMVCRTCFAKNTYAPQRETSTGRSYGKSKVFHNEWDNIMTEEEILGLESEFDGGSSSIYNAAKNVKKSSYPEAKESLPIKSEAQNYRCTRCNYSFKFDNSKRELMNLKCGYCGKSDKIIKK